jgi:exopolyphosphatase/guanosine-5'-triphosphate,3'-diphosphate pyrophosphatase
LSAILRIADGLDRSHFSVVKAVKVVLGKSVQLQAMFRYDPELELWTTERRKKLFEKIYHCSVELSASAVTTKDAA